MPELYFDVLDKVFRKNLDYGYKKGLYNTAKMRMSEKEIQKSRVWGWRAGIVGLAFNEMSMTILRKWWRKPGSTYY